MRKKSSSPSGSLSIFNPKYYLNRPQQLVAGIFALVCVVLLVSDRQSLTRAHQVEVLELKEELAELKLTLEDFKSKGSAVSKVGKDDDGGVGDDPVSVERREKVKEAMLHAWTSYEKYAWGHDELQPLTKSGLDSFGGLGATLVDSLDTLFIMGLHEQFQRAREWVANSLDFNKNYKASVFETTIRVVGGLLSAYDLSGDKIFLKRLRILQTGCCLHGVHLQEFPIIELI